MPELKQQEVPAAGLKVWNVFMDLINCRPARHAPVTWSELNNYLAVTGTELSPTEVNTWRALERTYLEAIPKD